MGKQRIWIRALSVLSELAFDRYQKEIMDAYRRENTEEKKTSVDDVREWFEEDSKISQDCMNRYINEVVLMGRNLISAEANNDTESTFFTENDTEIVIIYEEDER